MATTMNDNNSVDQVMRDVVQEKESLVGKYTGMCKWFNNKLGYGFVTICMGEEKGKDIFVHHTGVKPVNSNFNSLVKGEYVNFDITDGVNGPQAMNITGVNGWPLMCDHVYERRLNTKKSVSVTRNTRVSNNRLKKTFSV